MKTLTLGTFFGLKTTISFGGIVWFLGLISLCAWGSAAALALSPGAALVAGILSSAVMLVSDFAHQCGHALAARRAGYPMTGVHFQSLFSASQYPPDEPPLPPRIHIQRALGGFWVNVLIGLILTPAAYYFWPGGGVTAWVVAFTALINFFVIGLGALLPIDIPGVFTIDGGTIWRYWRASRKQ
jgi:hypothetical protein